MNGITRTGFMFALLLCVGCGTAHAAEKMPKGMFSDLDLSAKQEKQIREYFERQREDEKKDMKKVHSLQTELDNELLKERPDEARINATVGEIKKVQTKLLDKHFDRIFAIRKILTPEQFRKFTEKGRKMRAKMEGDRKKSKPHQPSTGEGFMPPPPPHEEE